MRPLVLAAVLAPLALASCTAPDPLPTISSLNFATETRSVAPGTHGVQIDGTVGVELSIGPVASLTIEANDNLLSRITTETRDGVLHVGMRGWTMGVTQIKVKLVLPKADVIRVSGVGDVEATGLTGGPLDIAVNGAGSVRVAGTADRLSIALTGIGGVNADALVAQDAIVTASGAGNVKLQALRTLAVTHSGIGSVTYRGTPQVTVSGNGIGRVRAARD